MQMQSTKEIILKAVEQFPQEITFEEVIDRLYFLNKIEKGLQDIETGKTVSHDEVKHRMKKL